MLNKFSQKKYEGGKKQEYRDRKQESGEDPREYYDSKEELWLQAYVLVEFKDDMLKGLYDTELKEICLFFMPKEPKRKGLRQYLTDSFRLFKTTYFNSFEIIENRERADKISLLYTESISAWSNQGSVMCLLSILNQ